MLSALVPTAAVPAAGVLNLDGLTSDVNKIIVVALLILFVIIVVSARRAQWGKAFGMVGIAVLGLVVLGLAGLVSSGQGAAIGTRMISAIFG